KGTSPAIVERAMRSSACLEKGGMRVPAARPKPRRSPATSIGTPSSLIRETAAQHDVSAGFPNLFRSGVVLDPSNDRNGLPSTPARRRNASATGAEGANV